MTHRVYGERADWFDLLTGPDDYDDEAEHYRSILGAAMSPVREVLELGSGGGNNAFHLKRQFSMTLVDLSKPMLAVSRRRNPDCDHHLGDMRTIRLGRRFDAVFVHDAVAYMTTESDLSAAVSTAFDHCHPGGLLLVAPKHFREDFRPVTKHGGRDGADGRALRYLHWSTDPDPDDTTYVVSLTCVFRQPDGSTTVESEEHLNGHFTRSQWEEIVVAAGFEATDISPTGHPPTVVARRPDEPGARSRPSA